MENIFAVFIVTVIREKEASFIKVYFIHSFESIVIDRYLAA